MATEMVPENENELGVHVLRFWGGPAGMCFQFTNREGTCVISMQEIQARMQVNKREG